VLVYGGVFVIVVKADLYRKLRLSAKHYTLSLSVTEQNVVELHSFETRETRVPAVWNKMKETPYASETFYKHIKIGKKINILKYKNRDLIPYQPIQYYVYI
jgi:hypothetical protein